MITPDALLEMLSRMVVASQLEDGVRVSTHVLYPSNGSVSVVVRGGKNSFVISDEGGAVSELTSAGLGIVLLDPAVKRRVRNRGLNVYDGAILSPPVSLEAVPAALLLVANASRDIAEWGLSHFSFSYPRNFRKDLAELLGRHFHDNLKHDTPIIGKSNKPHKFSHVLYLSGDRMLLVDPATNDASSINARVVANLDVRMVENPLIDQLIVFDDQLKWKGSDLKLWEVGAPTIPFSRAEPEIMRRAAA